MSLLLLLLLFTFQLSNAFPFPRNIVSPLEQLVSSQAVISTVASQVNAELVTENMIINEFTRFSSHPLIDTFYLFSILVLFIGQYKIIGDNLSFSSNKWGRVDRYTKVQKVTNRILFIAMVVLTKGVENAT